MIEWAEDSRTRQGLYRFIGVALRPPDSERLGMLATSKDYFAGRELDRFAYSRAWRRFDEHLDGEAPLRDLEVEYVRLFGVGLSGTPAMPTESSYRVPARDGGIAGFISMIQREYRAMGLVSVGNAEAPDHISTELEVMSYLCGVEADAWESGQSAQALEKLDLEARFLERHLAVWVPQFCRRARGATPSRFYESLIDLLHAFVIHEADYVRAVLRGSEHR